MRTYVCDGETVGGNKKPAGEQRRCLVVLEVGRDIGGVFGFVSQRRCPRISFRPLEQ